MIGTEKKTHRTSDEDIFSHVSLNGVRNESTGPVNGFTSHKCLQQRNNQEGMGRDQNGEHTTVGEGPGMYGQAMDPDRRPT